MSNQIYTIISEESLEKLVCSKCNNYLSYETPRVGSNEVICGRCNQQSTSLELFNENVRKYLFPCINRFNNCNTLLHFTQVENHEKLCVKNLETSCCECDFRGNGCQLYHHYLKKHPENVLKYPTFHIFLLDTATKTYLYRHNNILFFLKFQILKDKSLLQLSVKSIGNFETPQCRLELKTLMKQELLLNRDFQNKLDTEIDFISVIKKHCEKLVVCNLHVEPSTDLFTLKVQSRFRRPVQDATIAELQMKEKQLKSVLDALNKNLFPKLICSGCECYVIPPIFKCPQNHAVCENCKHSFCYSCKNIVNWSRAIDLEVFRTIIPFPCRWKCGSMLLSTDLRQHEKSCSSRRYKCLKSFCTWSGQLNELLKHLHNDQDIPFFKDTHDVYGFSEDLVEFYLIYDSEIFYCRMDKVTVSGRNCHIRKVSNVSIASEKYSTKVVFSHKCDNVMKKLTCNIKLGGITLVKKNYFTHFGHCKNYKMTFSVSVASL